MKGIILLQQLGELEEIVSFCRFQQLYPLNRSEIVLRKEKLGDLWDDRMKGVSKNLEAMQQILLVRSLLFSKGEDIHNWIEYCQLSLKSNQTELCDKTLKNLDTQVIVD